MMRGVGRWPAKTPRKSAWQGRGEGVGVRRAIPVGPEASSVERPLNSARAMRSAPQRFVETWIDAIVGFLFCVVLPIPIYATGEPFAAGLGGTEFTIIATAVGYSVVWYCGRRLDAFPRATLQGNIGYVAPIAVLTYALIAAILLLLRIDYSRVQFFGSGILTLLWMAGVAQLRARYLIRNYAVMPRSSIADMPVLATCRWLDFDDVQNRGMRGRRHRRRSQRRSRRGTGSPPWPTPRSRACRCSTAATSSRQ